MPQVHIKKLRTKNIKKEITRFLADVSYLPAKKKVFIKPNISGMYPAYSPCIVNPAVVEGVVEYLKDLGCTEIVVGELPVTRDVNAVFGLSGYRALAKRHTIQLLDLGEAQRRSISFRGFDISLPVIILDGQHEYINIAKLKTHIQTTVSLCTKNQKGLLDFSARRAAHSEGDLHENIKLLSKKIKPDYCIIDGTNALEGNGPGRAGKAIENFNLLMLSKDMEAIDWIGARVMGIEPKTIKHLSEPLTRIEVLGETVESTQRKFVLSKGHFKQFNVHFWITDKTCSGCSEAIGELKRDLFRFPLALMKFLYFAFLARLDILTGDIEIPNTRGKVVCFGNCMKEKAVVNNLPIVLGCPPQSKDLCSIL